MRRPPALLVLIGLAVAVGLWALWLMLRDESRTAVQPASIDFARLTPVQHAELVARGRYVARAANCEGCHNSERGSPYVGGIRLETPLGEIYGTNITPSHAHGIGRYTPDDLYRALVLGVVPGGRRLYPAMPYTSYHAIARADSDAIYAYLMSLPPVDRPNREPVLGFPFNIRALVAFWNLLYRPAPAEPGAVAGRSPEWNRGRYLVDALGHCGECHTPRNLAYAMQRDRYLQGFVIEGALSPDLTPEALRRHNWSLADLVGYLGKGLSPQGSPDFRMYQVLDTSTRYLTPEDLAAMATYLLDSRPAGQSPSAPPARVAGSAQTAAGTDDLATGRALYMGLCAGCHGDEYYDRPDVAVPMRTNSTARHENPLNFIRIVREGIVARELPGHGRRQRMPAFAALSDAEISHMLNYIRATWGGAPATVSAQDVAAAAAERN